MNNVQESAMNELLFGMTHEGDKLIQNFKALQDALKFPSGEVGVLLENKENLNLTDEELEAKMQEYTEEAADRDYQAAETNEERDQAKFKHMDDAVMYERYSQALDYRKNVERALSDFDAQLKVVTTAIEKFNETGVINQIQEAIREAEKNRRPGNESDKAYVDSLRDFVEFYNYYVNLCDGMRTMVSDRRAQYDEEFNAKRSAVKENNDRITAEIETVKAEIRDLSAEFEKLEDEEEMYLRTNDFDNPRYNEIVTRKKEINARRSELNNQIMEKQALLQSVPSFDYDFNSYKVGQRDIINLDLGLKRYLAEQGDLEQEMQKHAMDARNRAPRFEYFFDSEGKLIANIVVNGITKSKTVGDYKDLGYENINKAVKDLIFLVAASSKGLDLNTVARFDYHVAQVTPEGLEFVESNSMDTFSMNEVSKYLLGQVKDKKLEDDKLNDIRNIVEPEPVPTEPEPEPVQPEPVEPEPVEPEPVPTEPEKEEEPEKEDTKEPEEVTPVVETPRQEVPEGAVRVVSARECKVKVGNDNEITRKQFPGQDRNYEDLLKDRYARRFVTPAVAAVGIFAVAAIPALPVVLAAGGTLAVATVMGHSTEIVEAARRHKLNKLAKKAGLSIGYQIDDNTYKMCFVDSEGRPLSGAEAQEIAGDKVDLQAEVDKLADNKHRGQDYRKVFIESAEEKFENRTIKKIAKYAKQFDLQLDKDYLKEKGDIRFVDEDGNVLSDEAIAEQVDSLRDFKADVNELQTEYQKGMRELKNDQFYDKLLTSTEAQRYNRMSDMKPVTTDNLIGIFDDLGGIRLSKKKPNKIAKWIDKKLAGLKERLSLEDPEEQLINDVNLDVQEEAETVEQDAPEVTEEDVAVEETPEEPVVEDEVVPEEPAAEQEVTPVEEEIETSVPVEEEEVHVEEAPVEETAAAEPINSEDLDINEAIVNATTTAAPVIDEEAMEAERAATVQQAMAEDELNQPVAGPVEEPTQPVADSNDIQAYMEATIDNVESTLPDLIAANPAEAEKFVINHPEHQALYDSIVQSLEPESEGLGSK